MDSSNNFHSSDEDELEIVVTKQENPGDQTAELQSTESDSIRDGEESNEIEEDELSQNDAISEKESTETSNDEEKSFQNGEAHIFYRPLFKAIQENDWKGVEDFTKTHPKVLTATIKVFKKETFFHTITRNLDTPTWLMENLLKEVSPKSLEEFVDYHGESVIFRAAKYGHKKAVEAFVRRNPSLPNITNEKGYLPIHKAAKSGHKETVQFLLSVTQTRLDDKNGVDLLRYLINSGIYDVALGLLKRYPKLARESKYRGRILLKLANRPLAFESGSHMGYWKRSIYQLIPMQGEQIPLPESVIGDMENPSDQKQDVITKLSHPKFLLQISIALGALCQKLRIILWNALMQLAPSIKSIREGKLMHAQTLEIVRIMCHEEIIWSDDGFHDSLRIPFLTAARLGIQELVDEIQKAYFYSYLNTDKNDNGIFEFAVLNRREKLFMFLKKMNCHIWEWRAANTDTGKANFLHLAAKYVPSTEISGAALQMQRELQWFKAVERYVHPSLQEQVDEENRTPRQVFTEEHAKLLEQGEKWMKETAQSCTLVAALIITVVFAAAFTVPGGNNPEGMPMFLHRPSFLVFAVSDSLALFSSTASLLMFLGILTSRYAEEDFLKSLPSKLIIGLVCLFFSIATMMVAFGATIYIFLSHPWKWVIVPISLLGCVPVTLFGLLQFPLFLEIFSSTYHSRILQPIIRKSM